MAVLLGLLLGLASCYDNDPSYPPEPEISFLNVGEVSFDGVDNDAAPYRCKGWPFQYTAKTTSYH